MKNVIIPFTKFISTLEIIEFVLTPYIGDDGLEGFETPDEANRILKLAEQFNNLLDELPEEVLYEYKFQKIVL